MKDINCPYCDAELDINHDAGYGYDENELHEQECSKCNKSFVYSASIIWHYNPQKADCLNDGNHDYKPTKVYPKCFTKMRCKMCGTERKPTESERSSLSIPTYQEELPDLIR